MFHERTNHTHCDGTWALKATGTVAANCQQTKKISTALNKLLGNTCMCGKRQRRSLTEWTGRDSFPTIHSLQFIPYNARLHNSNRQCVGKMSNKFMCCQSSSTTRLCCCRMDPSQTCILAHSPQEYLCRALEIPT